MRNFKISAVVEIFNHSYFVNHFFKKKLLVGFVVLIFNSFSSSAQCLEKDTLWNRLIFLRSSSVPYTDQLKELLQYESHIEDCSYKNDSTHAFLLQRIGSTFYMLGDYYNAIKFTKQSIHIITYNIGKPFVNPKHLVRYYYGLSLFYDSLGNSVERMNALDSSVTIAIRTNFFDKFSAWSLNESIKYLMDIGDYERCIKDAVLGNEMTKKYLHGDDSITYIYTFDELEANALIAIKNYDAVEKLYANKIGNPEKTNDYDLATLFEQLALVFTEKKNFNKAISYFGQSRNIDEKNKRFLGCAITTYNEGYNLYAEQLRDKKTALYYYRKALQYVYKAKKIAADSSIKFELLSILDNIGNLFVSSGQYDSALYFFQKAFDMVKPGMNETSLLNSSQNDFLQNKSINYLIGLVLDKAETFLKSGTTSKNTGKIKEAIRIYKVADKLVERVNTNQSEYRSKLFWRKEAIRLYENAIEASYLQ
ncbi:MAG TPA: hypothetical protein VHZ50_16550, partial [Puia sp.]|nr:hypothetical protein [Puia sp.]